MFRQQAEEIVVFKMRCIDVGNMPVGGIADNGRMAMERRKGSELGRPVVKRHVGMLSRLMMWQIYNIVITHNS